MKLRTLSTGLVALSILGALGLSSQACTEIDIDPASAKTDAGPDAADDAATDSETSTPPDADAGPIDHPGVGYTTVATSLDPRTGAELAMTLDANDDPLLAYLAYATGSDAPSLVFVQWDTHARRFTLPVIVDRSVGPIDVAHGARQVSIAYDATTKRVSIAYQKIAQGDSAAAPSVWLASATLGKDANGFTQLALFASAQVSDVAAAGAAGNPSIGVSGGKTYVAYAQKNWQCCPPEDSSCAACTGVWMVESTPVVPADAGADAAPIDSAVADAADASADAAADATLSSDAVDGGTDDAATDFDASDSAVADANAPSSPTLLLARQLMQYGGAPARARFDAPTSLAIDSTGSPGIAFFATPGAGQGAAIFFWQAGMTDAQKVRDSGNVANDTVDVSLVFDGTQPRFIAAMADDKTPTSDIQFNASSDGSRWGTSSPVAPEKGPRITRSAALAISGDVSAVVAHRQCAGLNADDLCDDLYVATSTNGIAWHDEPTPGSYATSSPTIAFGRSDAKGQLMVAFHSDGRLTPWITPHRVPPAVVFWRP